MYGFHRTKTIILLKRKSCNDVANSVIFERTYSKFAKKLSFTATELSPLKYISMLMNSIWGQYNRYSPHNVKKINDANLYYTGEMQQ